MKSAASPETLFNIVRDIPRGKLTGVKGWVERRIAAQPDLTIDELTAELAAEHGVKVHRSSVGRLLLRLGLSHKKRPASA